MKIRELFLFCFTMFYKENMFTINLEDGREAPSKARKKGAKRLEFLVFINFACLPVCLYPINVKTAEPIGPKFFV